MSTDNWIRFDEQESDAVAVAALSAARACIKAPAYYCDGNGPSPLPDIIKAFAVVSQAAQQARQDKMAANLGKDCHDPCIDEHGIVATAVFFAGEADRDFKPHPNSQAGMMVLAYAQACRALEALSNLDSIIGEPYDLPAAYMADQLLDHMNAASGDVTK